jgi:amino acid transporter
MTQPVPAAPDATVPPKNMGMVSAIAISLSGMMGSGLYSVLGYANLTAGTHIPIAFFAASMAVSFTVYSFAKLSATYPGRGGGPAGFMQTCYGDGFVSGWMNLFMCLGFLLATSLYASSCTDFISVLAGPSISPGQLKVIGSVVVVLFAMINLLGASIVGRAASAIIGLVFLALIAFATKGMTRMDFGTMQWKGGTLEGIAVATGMLYINFQGFAVVTSAAQSMADPRKMLPRAMYIAVTLITILYITVSWVAIQITPHTEIVQHAGDILGEAAQIIAGKTGFIIIVISALLACVAAVNATIFIAAKVFTFVVGQHPEAKALARLVGTGSARPLLISSGIVIVLVLGFPLVAVGKMASMAFLLIFGVISFGHLRIRKQTGAAAPLLWIGIVINGMLFTSLFINAVKTSPASALTLVAALVGTFLLESLYRWKYFGNTSPST